MPLYEYETVTTSSERLTRRFHWRQRITEPSFTHHPETGEPVRRVISGGLGALLPSRSGSAATAALAAEQAAAPDDRASPMPAGGCGPSCGCVA